MGGGENPAYFHSCDKDSEVNPVFWLESQMERDEGRVAAGRHFEGSHCPLSFMWRGSDTGLPRQDTARSFHVGIKQNAACRDGEIWGESLTIHPRPGAHEMLLRFMANVPAEDCLSGKKEKKHVWINVSQIKERNVC